MHMIKEAAEAAVVFSLAGHVVLRHVECGDDPLTAPRLPRADLENALRALLDLGYIDSHGDGYVQTIQEYGFTDPAVEAVFRQCQPVINRYYQELIEQALQSGTASVWSNIHADVRIHPDRVDELKMELVQVVQKYQECSSEQDGWCHIAVAVGPSSMAS